MAEADKIYVYENWSGDIPVKMGTLYVDGNRGKNIYSFEYDDLWLEENANSEITFDPDLALYNGRQMGTTTYEKTRSNPGTERRTPPQKFE